MTRRKLPHAKRKSTLVLRFYGVKEAYQQGGDNNAAKPPKQLL